LEVIETADLGLVNRLDGKAFTGGETDAFAYGTVVSRANYLWADFVVLENVRILARDIEIAVLTGDIEGLDSPRGRRFFGRDGAARILSGCPGLHRNVTVVGAGLAED
jgi:hypothetical protein